MPHYLFHLVSPEAQVPDDDGIDLADTWAARREALLIADELLKPGSPAQLRKWRGWSLQVVEERGGQVLFVPIVDLVAGTDDDAERSGPGRAARDGTGGHSSGTFRTTLRLAAEAVRQIEQCRQLKRAVGTQIELARETVRLSAELIERGRTLAIGNPPR